MKHRGSLVILIAVVLISNAIALINVGRNRAAEPAQTIELTERELPLQSADQDNTGIVLRLSWMNRRFVGNQRQPGIEDFIDQAKLEELGFRLDHPRTALAEHKFPLPRKVFVALEYDGEAWRRWINNSPASEENASRQSQADPQSTNRLQPRFPSKPALTASRLFAVDAAGGFEPLRRKYPEQGKYLIVQAIVKAVVDGDSNRTGDAIGSPKWGGYVTEILPNEIFVPLPFSRELSRLKARADQSPRYSVILKYGHSYEPWVAGIKINGAATQKLSAE